MTQRSSTFPDPRQLQLDQTPIRFTGSGWALATLLREPHFRQKVGNDLVPDALQYGGIQTSYSWDCWGIAFEYQRPAVGVTNENEKYFSITLAGVGAAGNLKHAERIF